MPHSRVAAVALLAAPVFAFAAAAQTPYSGHGAASVPAEIVARYAPPPLDSAVSARIQQALDLRTPGLGLLSPDATKLFFNWSITGVSQVWRLDGPDRFPIQMTGGEDRTGVVDVTPDGRLLVVSRDHGGQEDPGLYLQPVEGGPLATVQHVPGARTLHAFTTADGRYLYYLANDRDPASYALYRYERATGARELVFGEPGLWAVADRREDAGRLSILLAKLVSSRAQEYYRLEDGRLEPLFGQGEETRFAAAWGRAAGEVLVRTDKLGDFARLYRWTRERGYEPISPAMDKEVSDFAIDEARQRILYTVNDGGYERLNALDAATLAPLALPEFPGADHVYAGSSTRDGRFTVLGIETARAPRKSYVYEWATGKLTPWTMPSAPETDTARFAAPRLEHYPARDGTAIPVFVRYPDGCDPDAGAPRGPCPVIVDFHGGPEGQAQPGFSPLLQVFVDAGFVYAEPNVRGSSGYGKTWLDADNGAQRLEIWTDIEDAAKHFRARLAKNGRSPKVGVTGGSYGGYSTLAAMTRFAGAYDAGASVVGISDLRTFLANTAPYRRQLRASEYGDPERDAETLRQLSPVTYLDSVRAPLLLIQGVDDPRVPAGEAIQMHEAMQAKGLPSELILLAGEGHGSARRANQALEWGHVLRFFEQHLKEPAAE